MRCPGCANETSSNVLLCLKCGWKAPTFEEATRPREEPRRLDARYIQGGFMILVGLGLTEGSYALQQEAGRSQFAFFYGLLIAGLLRILQAVRDRSTR